MSDITMLQEATMPPSSIAVEAVDSDGNRTYERLPEKPNMVDSVGALFQQNADLQAQNQLLTDTMDTLMTSILPELMGK